MKYPDEACVFEVMVSVLWVRTGMIVEGVEIDGFVERNRELGVSAVWASDTPITTHRYTFWLQRSSLRPLTPAAREMLAIVQR